MEQKLCSILWQVRDFCYHCSTDGVRTSEFYPDGTFSEGPQLPVPTDRHCVVAVEPGLVLYREMLMLAMKLQLLHLTLRAEHWRSTPTVQELRGAHAGWNRKESQRNDLAGPHHDPEVAKISWGSSSWQRRVPEAERSSWRGSPDRLVRKAKFCSFYSPLLPSRGSWPACLTSEQLKHPSFLASFLVCPSPSVLQGICSPIHGFFIFFEDTNHKNTTWGKAVHLQLCSCKKGRKVTFFRKYDYFCFEHLKQSEELKESLFFPLTDMTFRWLEDPSMRTWVTLRFTVLQHHSGGRDQLCHNQSVQYEDTFLLVGGSTCSDQALATIYQCGQTSET